MMTAVVVNCPYLRTLMVARVSSRRQTVAAATWSYSWLSGNERYWRTEARIGQRGQMSEPPPGCGCRAATVSQGRARMSCTVIRCHEARIELERGRRPDG